MTFLRFSALRALSIAPSPGASWASKTPFSSRHVCRAAAADLTFLRVKNPGSTSARPLMTSVSWAMLLTHASCSSSTVAPVMTRPPSRCTAMPVSFSKGSYKVFMVLPTTLMARKVRGAESMPLIVHSSPMAMMPRVVSNFFTACMTAVAEGPSIPPAADS